MEYNTDDLENLLLDYASEQSSPPRAGVEDIPSSSFENLSELALEEKGNYPNTTNLSKILTSELLEKKPINVIERSKILIERMIFNRYFYVQPDGTRFLYAKRTLSGFNIYLNQTENMIGRMHANIFGTKYTFEDFLEIKYETSFLDRGKPRSFKIKLDGLGLINKKPYFNTETNSFSLNFSGRVTKPSVRNFQIIHPLEPTYITLTFGKEENDSFILDFSHPWSILSAFCVGLSALDHKFGCD